MFSLFFIDRPKFALVISIIITLAGLLAINSLPIEEFPNITPPQVQVKARYPGASAEAVEESVAAVIEAQVNGVDVAGFVPMPSGAPGGPLNWGAGNNDGSLDVPPGSTKLRSGSSSASKASMRASSASTSASRGSRTPLFSRRSASGEAR